jgi:hypothetical protein
MTTEILTKVGQADDLVEEFSAWAELEDNVIVLARLRKLDQFDDIRVIDLAHNLDLFEDVRSLYSS